MAAEAKQAAPELPKVMRAVRILKYAPKERLLEGLKLVDDAPVPAVEKGDVLVRVAAASINPVDWKVAAGHLQLVLSPPLNAGFDFAGEVVQVGPGATKFKVGDKVHGCCSYKRQGSFAEYVAVPETHTALKPANLTFAEAASVTMAIGTSYQALHNKVQLKRGEKVVILGGAGGMGSMGIQLAKAMGASEIVVTASPANAEFCRALGATDVVDYRTQDVGEVLKGRNFDVLYDTVGGSDAGWIAAQKVLNGKSGRFVGIASEKKAEPMSLGGFAEAAGRTINRKFWSMFNNPSYCTHLMDGASVGSDLEHWRRAFESGELRPTVTRVLPFEGFAELYEGVVSGKVRGKSCLAVSAKANEK
jgi:alcohol dehydrogenase